MLAGLRGQVSVDELRPQLAATAGAYDDFLAAEDLRQELAGSGITLWTASPAETSQLLCAWNAYALRSLADAFIAAETGSSRPSDGHLARITADQVSLLLADVNLWSARARRAAADPGYDVAAEAVVPAQLTAWVAVEPCPRSHLEAMRAGTAALFERAETAFGDLERLSSAAEAGSVARLRGLIAEVQTRAGATALVRGVRLGPAAHESMEAALRDGASRCFVLGQLLARPRLLDRPLPPPPYPGRAPAGSPAGSVYPHDHGHGHGGHHGGHDGHH